MERWLPVVGFEGKYEVSDQGRVRSVSRSIVCGNRWGKSAKRNYPGHVLSPLINTERGGYRYFNLHVEGIQTMRRAAVLVAAAFIGPRPKGLEVAHENGIATDDRAENLFYKTKLENAADRERHGTQLKGETHPSSRLDQVRVTEIKRLVKSGVPQPEIAAQFGICQQHVSNIALGKRWAHVL